jgi:stearoyl-CoA desaturase (delta-9 desaturase)
MTRARKFTNLLAVGLPPLALVLAIVLLWHKAVGPLALILLGVFYVLTSLGVTLGYHRLFTHRSFQTSAPVRAALAILGSMAIEGSVITWVADHRKHHAFTDQQGDPHSPHLAGPGISGALKGLWHAHCGWLFRTVGQAERERFAPDMLKDPVLVRIDRLFLLWLALSFALPAALGLLIGGTAWSALMGLIWGGAVRVLLLHHVTWSINSVCHFFGRRRFDVADESRNVFWLAPLSMGESWHHNHHAFPTSAFHGLTLAERATDPTGLVILAMERLGLVWGVVRVSPERQAAKLVGAAQAVRSAAAEAATNARGAAVNARQAATGAAGAARQAASDAAGAARQAASGAGQAARDSMSGPGASGPDPVGA